MKVLIETDLILPWPHGISIMQKRLIIVYKTTKIHHNYSVSLIMVILKAALRSQLRYESNDAIILKISYK